jgi:O-antigen/teichoic acid export membrane protein
MRAFGPPSRATILASLMRSRLLWRRSATALGTYASTALGIVGTVVAIRLLGRDDFGRLTLVVATAAFFQLLLELTSDEALVKYGFRYSERGDWGRFRRLVRLTFTFEVCAALLAGAFIAALAPFADSIFRGAHGLTTPMLIAGALPLLQACEALGAAMLLLRSRYDVRAAFLTFGTAVRLAAIVIGAPHGVTATVVALVVAQAITSAVLGAVAFSALRRFPRATAEPLGDDRAGILRFVLQSSVGTGILSLRGWIAPLLLGLVRTPGHVAWFRAAQAPQQGFGALSSPVRLIMLTEQTRDWERGQSDVVMAGVKRYVFVATAIMAVALAPLMLLMPWLVRVFLKPDFLPAVPAARIMLVAAAIQLVFGWTKSFPVSIGRPGLRIVAHGIEVAVLVPFLLWLGSRWGATGAAGAVLISTVVFAIVWTVIILRMRNEPSRRAEAAPAPL